MIIARTRSEVTAELDRLRPRGALALVPTMGSLHKGHLSLLDIGRERASTLAVTIFVNPLQFGPEEDLESYPHDLERDLALCAARGVDLVWAPPESEVFPSRDSLVLVDPGPMGDRLCGAFRPGHFPGVLTVVAELLALFHPQVAVFGAKDFQQSVLVRLMVEDLGLGTQIVVAPIIREADGLAMSSRNKRLKGDQREAALVLSHGIEAALNRFGTGERDAERLVGVIRAYVQEAPAVELQYAEIVDPQTLEGRTRVSPGDVAAVAVFVGGVRLIDNMVFK